MTAAAQELIRRGSVDEIVINRARVLDGYRTSLALLGEAMRRHGEVLQGYGGLNVQIDHRHFGIASLDETMKTITDNIDRALWRHLLEATGLRDLMDRQALNDFEKSLEKNPPEATKENLVATFTRLGGQSGMIFERGLVNVFQGADRRYRSNDPFRLDKRLVMTYVFSESCGFFHCNSDRRQSIADMDRIFHILDEKPPKTHLVDAGHAVYVAKPPDVIECSYFRVKLFKNGNAHIDFTRPDLVEKANKLIASHFAGQLAHDSRPPAAGGTK